ncbi:condensation domain-containing protein [Streptomyces sp. 378]|uniref:condensation domain-containing protein n=1 Tax=Streptomyces sp. 378 TaxID=3049412 RepID=UPI0024C2F92B|nr:condensation domain-containing protein [Streptomyces sp. 378]MDK1347379.1 condensation domain-containing protein [Streptomyces sp. 378]
MRMTDIQHCEVRPGRLVEWTLDPAAAATVKGLREDSRPPAYIQESHIRASRSVREDGLFVPTWIGVGFDLPGRTEPDVLQDALHAWTLRHETLRSGFTWSGPPDDEMVRFTLDSEDVRLHREEIGDFTDETALAVHLQNRFDIVADALRWPNFIYAAVIRDDSTSVYMAFDHSNVDAYSLQNIPATLHELCAAAAAGRCPTQQPVASYVDFCETERADADNVDDGHDTVARWREFIKNCDGQLPNFPVDLGLDPDGGLPPQKVLCGPLVDADDAAAFEAHCRPYGGSLVGVLAATALIVHEIGGEPVFRTVVPFHTRATSRWSDSVGWYVGGAPVEIQVAEVPGFHGALENARTALRANRRLARTPLERVLRLLGTDFRPTSPDLYSLVSFLDARDIPGSERWAELKTYGLVRVSYGDRVCVWVNRLHEGLWFACRYPDTDIAHKNLSLYATRLREVITSVARQG